MKDPKIPFLSTAIDPLQIQKKFTQNLQITQNTQIEKIQIIRHKPGRRCLIEYQLINEHRQNITLIGKIRAKGTDINSYQLQKTLWETEFNENSTDRISVPEPVGIIPEWQMWLQRKIEGVTFTKILTPKQYFLNSKIAEIAHKLHTTNIPPRRSHTLNDELKILHDKIPLVWEKNPQWQKRLERILEECNHLGNSLIENQTCGIHRDFYPEQIIVNNERLYLIDLDLYCQGNPALDIGNFIAHIQEYSLRVFGNARYLQELETAIIQRFIQLTSEKFRVAIEIYTTLTLVRHIYISTLFLERAVFTESILNLCEQRLNIIGNS
ncbi:phosphotransferase family protein [Sphaerospermopsis torques-reginae]|uniref:Aminoglycoside phosphotransferase family protein n=1 Tax=Sphaerospermopsis torques-reginae ITEP-024 TaxID=984208 RepID=A0ABX8WUH4_9CYAN|nr:phosphotransferase [Sphaerospermopsis torques-reginae]QYX30050.1 aminoglycoside phosphotransferase family protein [Sphaerospermopsis torques-reginae ITEP-024]